MIEWQAARVCFHASITPSPFCRRSAARQVRTCPAIPTSAPANDWWPRPWTFPADTGTHHLQEQPQIPTCVPHITPRITGSNGTKHAASQPLRSILVNAVKIKVQSTRIRQGGRTLHDLWRDRFIRCLPSPTAEKATTLGDVVDSSRRSRPPATPQTAATPSESRGPTRSNPPTQPTRAMLPLLCRPTDPPARQVRGRRPMPPRPPT